MTYFYIAAAVIAAVGAISAGESQKDAMEYQAAVEEQQGQLSRRNAGAQEEDQRQRARAFQGRQLAAIGESGTTLSGSASDLFRESLFSAEMDALNIRYEGELGNASATNAATASRMNGKNAQRAGYFSAASSIASGAAGGYGNQQRIGASKNGLNG